MAESRNRFFSKLATNIDSSGGVTAEAMASGVQLGPEGYDSAGLLPAVGTTIGEQAFVTSTGRLYIWNGGGWYSIGLINETPSIQSILDGNGDSAPFSLATDGSTQTVVTVNATDPESDPLTYSITDDGSLSGIANVSQASNVFTFTPLAEGVATPATSTVTFRVTDGINVATQDQEFTLSFAKAWSLSSSDPIIAFDRGGNWCFAVPAPDGSNPSQPKDFEYNYNGTWYNMTSSVFQADVPLEFNGTVYTHFIAYTGSFSSSTFNSYQLRNDAWPGVTSSTNGAVNNNAGFFPDPIKPGL